MLCGLTYLALLACNYLKIKFGPTHIILGICMWYLMLQFGIEVSITGVLFAFAIPIKDLTVIEKAIQRSVNILILPLFAKANAAIIVPANILSAIGILVGMGIILGLVIGKPVGIFLVSRLMIGLNIAQLL